MLSRLACALLLVLPLTTLLSPGPARAHSDVRDVGYEDCYDGDTCIFAVPGKHPFFRERYVVHLRGVDAPEIEGSCERERNLAEEARRLLHRLLRRAARIDLIDLHYDDTERAEAIVLADGRDVAEALLRRRLAVRLDGAERPAWCGEGSAPTGLPRRRGTR